MSIIAQLRGKTLREIKTTAKHLKPDSCFSIGQLMISSSSNKVEKEQINKLCLLSRVSIKDDLQLTKLTNDVNNIVLCLDILQSSPVSSNIKPMYSPMQFYEKRNNRWREDIPTTNTSEAESISRRRDIIHSNTKDVKAGYFVAPKVK